MPQQARRSANDAINWNCKRCTNN